MTYLIAALLAMALTSCGDPTPELVATPQSKAQDAAGLPQTPSSLVRSDREALVALYSSSNGPNWKGNINWLSGMPLGEWYGVTTDENGRVTELDLSENRLRGEIPPELGSLSELKILDLSWNRLGGVIPPELGDLPKLQLLDLSRNVLKGGIPQDFGNLSRLEVLNLRLNGLYGWVPPDLGNLTNLKKLGLGKNRLIGSFPLEMRNLQSLTYLDIGLTSLIGCVPGSWKERLEIRPESDYLDDEKSSLGGLPFCVETSEPELPAERDALIALYNSAGGAHWKNDLNWLTGQPIGIWHGVKVDPSGRVIELKLPGNELSGAIPPELGNLTGLRVLDLHGNMLHGEIPVELGSLASLNELDLHENELSGEIPPEFGSLANLESLDLSRNRLSGGLPPELGHLANLIELQLQINELGREIPREFGRLSRLELLSLWSNRLEGEIPAELGEIPNLRLLDLHGNALDGEIPSQLGALTSLERLGTDRNDLVGCVPSTLRGRLTMSESTLGRLPFCGYASVSHASAATGADRDALVALYQAAGGRDWKNKMHWLTDRPIREWHGVEVNENGRVTQLKLIRNGLIGEIPAELSSLSDLQVLYLITGKLSGEIPPELGNLLGLQGLALAGTN